jgi:hypothetical protein
MAMVRPSAEFLFFFSVAPVWQLCSHESVAVGVVESQLAPLDRKEDKIR